MVPLTSCAGWLSTLTERHAHAQWQGPLQDAGQQLWHPYGLPGFVPDVRAFLLDPMAALSARGRQQLPDAPLDVAATSPAEPSRSVPIRINHDAPAERLQIRSQSALRICEPLLSGRP